jgi:RimJ/RimL family protein N-acetyltransferase
MELSNDVVTLRTPVRADAPAVAAAVQASLEAIQPWMPWATDDYGIGHAMAWITGELEPDAVGFVIVDDDGQIVGSCGLNGFDVLNLRANLGYWLRPDRTGRGYATAATRLVAAHGFDRLDLQRIEIIMSVENEPSRRVAERAGALHEGVLRNRLRLHGRQHDADAFAYLVGGPRP